MRIDEAGLSGSKRLKLSIGKAWEETTAFLAREARLVAPVALATFALPSALGDWAFPGGNAGAATGWLLLLVTIVMLVGQMTIILLANGWRGSIGEAMGKAAKRLPVLIGALLIAFLPVTLVAVAGFGASLASAGITDPATLTPDAIARLPRLTTFIALGIVAHDSLCRTFGMALAKAKFAHGAAHALPGGKVLIDSYHCSRYNQNTKRLNAAMFDAVFAKALERDD